MESTTHLERIYFEIPTLASVPWLGSGKTEMPDFLYDGDKTSETDERFLRESEGGAISSQASRFSLE